LRGGGVVDIEGFLGDEGGDVFVALAVFVIAGLGRLFGRHRGGCREFLCWVSSFCVEEVHN
jgi:hypothetical protein